MVAAVRKVRDASVLIVLSLTVFPGRPLLPLRRENVRDAA
jgi:hypothetical protein